MSKEKNLKKSLACFVQLLKIGLFTFGGGWSIVAQLQREFVEKRGWIPNEELVDITSIARSMPGIMIINIAVMFGYRVGGVLCGAMCAIGVALPSVAVLSVVAIFYNSVRDNPYIARALVGVRACVAPVLISAAMRLKNSSLTDKLQYLIAACAFALCLLSPLNNILIVVLGALAGLALQGGRRHDLS